MTSSEEQNFSIISLPKSDSSHNFFLRNEKFVNRSFRPTTPYSVAVWSGEDIQVNYTTSREPHA